MNRVLGFALATIAGQGIVLSQSTIYGVAAGPQSPYTLYRISAATGAGSVVAPISAFEVRSIAFAPNGSLYGSALEFFSLKPLLVTINTSTGAATQIKSITGVTGNSVPNDFAFRSDGLLFALYGGKLYTIDVSSGVATLIGIPNTTDYPVALAFSSGDTLYLADKTNLYTVNQTTGAASLMTSLAYDASLGLDSQPGSMEFDPVAGTLYVSIYGASSSLGTINISTGAVTRIGPTVSGLRAIAVGPAVTPSPTPAPASLFLVCTGMLILFGCTRWRRVNQSSLAASARACTSASFSGRPTMPAIHAPFENTNTGRSASRPK
jgi:hypothetical protein